LDITAYALRRAGFKVNAVSAGDEALDSWRSDDHDIIVLDVNMPTVPGIQVCKTIRNTSRVPVVLMSGSRKDADIMEGFEAGADDYVFKPFNVRHMVMKLQAMHRRASGNAADVSPRRLLIGPLEVDLDSFAVSLENRSIRLTRLEFRLLYCLASNVGRVVSSPKLIDFAWGMDEEGDASLLKTHFSHIRRKLKDASEYPIEIRSLPGAGYSLHVSSTV
jgi:two-component system, OmpR family, response regulator RegX3